MQQLPTTQSRYLPELGVQLVMCYGGEYEQSFMTTLPVVCTFVQYMHQLMTSGGAPPALNKLSYNLDPSKCVLKSELAVAYPDNGCVITSNSATPLAVSSGSSKVLFTASGDGQPQVIGTLPFGTCLRVYETPAELGPAAEAAAGPLKPPAELLAAAAAAAKAAAEAAAEEGGEEGEAPPAEPSAEQDDAAGAADAAPPAKEVALHLTLPHGSIVELTTEGRVTMWPSRVSAHSRHHVRGVATHGAPVEGGDLDPASAHDKPACRVVLPSGAVVSTLANGMQRILHPAGDVSVKQPGDDAWEYTDLAGKRWRQFWELPPPGSPSHILVPDEVVEVTPAQSRPESNTVAGPGDGSGLDLPDTIPEVSLEGARKRCRQSHFAAARRSAQTYDLSRNV